MAEFEISREMAAYMVEFISGKTGYGMIVCDHNGVIIGATAVERIGQSHAIAARITRGEIQESAVTKEDVEKNPLMREGYNCGIYVGKDVVGTFGIAGPVDVVKPLAQVAASVIASMIEEEMRKKMLQQVVDVVQSSVHQAAAAIEEISAGSQELAATCTNVVTVAEGANEKVKNTYKILEFIRNIADQTRLLGLNASIEAARAGEHGRGFTVVAMEVQKLATNSTSSVEQINAVLKDFQDSIGQVTGGIRQTSQISNEQSKAMQDIISTVEKIQSAVEQLVASMNHSNRK